jgi:hypothetical protein
VDNLNCTGYLNLKIEVIYLEVIFTVIILIPETGYAISGIK